MKLLFLLFLSFNTFAFLIPAEEAKRQRNDNIRKDRTLCIKSWEKDVEQSIEEAILLKNCGVIVHTLDCDVSWDKKSQDKMIKKLNKLGYKVDQQYTGKIYIIWCTYEH